VPVWPLGGEGRVPGRPSPSFGLEPWRWSGLPWPGDQRWIVASMGSRRMGRDECPGCALARRGTLLLRSGPRHSCIVASIVS